MAVAALLVAPAGLASGSRLLEPAHLWTGLLVAVLAGLVPFSLELIALRHVAARVFGVLMSLSPVAAAASGWLLLDERLELREIVAMLLVMGASIVTVRTREDRTTPSSVGPLPEAPTVV